MQRLWQQIRNRSGQSASPRGMTLVEIMIVITIMASIMGVVSFAVFNTLDQAKTKNAKMGIEKLNGIVQSYYLMQSPNKLPDSIDELAEGANPMVKEKSELKDPWNNKYIYEKNGNQDYTIYSVGPDGQRGTKDDVYPKDDQQR